MSVFTAKQVAEEDCNIITFEKPVSPAAEAYRRIKVNLEFSSDGGMKVVQACSARSGEGKTKLLLNLAATYVEEGKKAVIVDLDLRNPKIHSALGGNGEVGLIEYLSGNITLDEAICKAENGIEYIARGKEIRVPSAVLNSAAIKDLFEKLKEKYDVVLVDCPPVLSFSDCCVSARLCDGTLFVVSHRTTDKKAAKTAISVLRRNNVKLIGCVFCDVNARESLLTADLGKNK